MFNIYNHLSSNNTYRHQRFNRLRHRSRRHRHSLRRHLSLLATDPSFRASNHLPHRLLLGRDLALPHRHSRLRQVHRPRDSIHASCTCGELAGHLQYDGGTDCVYACCRDWGDEVEDADGGVGTQQLLCCEYYRWCAGTLYDQPYGV